MLSNYTRILNLSLMDKQQQLKDVFDRLVNRSGRNSMAAFGVPGKARR